MNGIRKRLAGSGVAVLLVLAACGGTTAPAAPAGSTPASTTSSAPAPAASVSANAPGANASTSGSAAATGKPASNAPIRIGYIMPLTGVQANVGKDNTDAFKLYLDSLNNTIAGRKIEVILADETAPDAALTKAKELIENQHVDLLMGIGQTPVGYAIAPYVKQAQVPLLITGNAGGEGMTTDPKFASPYLIRFTQTATQVDDTAADWAIKQGKKKAILFTSDTAPGIQNSDLFSTGFIRKGGSILQEMHPAVGTTDFGPFLARLDQSADFLFTFLPGVDGLRFMEQYANYGGANKPTIYDNFGVITSGANVAQLKDRALGVVSATVYSEANPNASNQAFLKAWRAKYPDRLVSGDAGTGWAAGQILAAALQKVNGNVEDRQKFLDALYATNLDTTKGTIKLDQSHDVISTTFFYTIAKDGNNFSQKLLTSYSDVSDNWDLSDAQISKLLSAGMKGKWPGATKDQVDKLIGA